MRLNKCNFIIFTSDPLVSIKQLVYTSQLTIKFLSIIPLLDFCIIKFKALTV